MARNVYTYTSTLPRNFPRARTTKKASARSARIALKSTFGRHSVNSTWLGSVPTVRPARKHTPAGQPTCPNRPFGSSVIRRKLRKSKGYSERTPKERSSLSGRNTTLAKVVVELEVDGEEDDGMVMVEGEAGDKPTITGGEEVTMVNAIALHPRFGNRCFDMP